MSTFQAVKNQSQTELVDEEAVSQIRKGHETMCVVLTSRHKNLDTVRAVWSTGDIKARMWRCLRFMRGTAEQCYCLVGNQFCLIQNLGSQCSLPGCTTECCCVPAGVERSQTQSFFIRELSSLTWLNPCSLYLVFEN